MGPRNVERKSGKDRHASNHYPTADDAHTAQEIVEPPRTGSPARQVIACCSCGRRPRIWRLHSR